MLQWMAILLVGSAMARGPKPFTAEVKVTVLATTPAAAYNWVGSANGPLPCLAAQCEQYFLHVEPGYPTADKVLRLLMPDTRIAIIECYAKEVPGINYAIQMLNGDDADVPIRRVCVAPAAGSSTNASFSGNDVRLIVPRTSRKGQPMTERYHIKGFLQPLPEEAAPEGHSAFVTTVPVGARIFLDGQRVGTAPAQVRITAGLPHTFMVEKDGFKPSRQSVSVDSDQNRFNFVLTSDQ